jgi:carbon storage regulator
VLVISRKQGESIKVSDDIEIVVISVDGPRVRLGIKAPRNVKVLRSELDVRVADSNKVAAMNLQQSPEDLLKVAADAKRNKP